MRSLSSSVVLALVLVAASCGALFAVTTATWRVATDEDFTKGNLENVVYSSAGELALGLRTTRVESGEISVWSSAVDAKGAVYFGTGNRGKVLRYEAGKLTEAYATGELVVSCLAADSAGNVYAGTLPEGRVFKIPASGAPALLAKLPEAYVWALAVGPGDKLYAGTGPKGKVYAIAPDGKFEPVLDSKDDHVLAVAAAADGTVYAGTSNNGLLLRVRPGKPADVVYDFDEQEVRAISVQGDALLVAANKAKKFEPDKFVKKLKKAVERAKEEGAGGEAGESPFADLFDGALYRVGARGDVRPLFTLQKTYVTSLAVDKSGNAFLTTGDEGKVYRVQPDGTSFLLFDFNENQATTAAVVGGRLAFVATANSGVVYAVEEGQPEKGAFTSEVKDAKFFSQWGTLSWNAVGRVAVSTRSGNSALPDATWSEWSAPLTASGAGVTSPAGRFLQFRITWSEDKAAVVRWVLLNYLRSNQQPRVAELAVEGVDPDAAFAGKAKESNEVAIKWKADDPDGDTLVFNVFYQREGTTDWLPANAEPITRKELKWDTTLVPDGWYAVKVVASDERMNPPDAALAHAKVAKPVLIDNRKPSIGALAVAEDLGVTGVAEDTGSNIARIEYSVDGKEWHFIYPEDGLYDQKSEKFGFSLKGAGLGMGRHFVTVKAYDAAGNVAVQQEGFGVK